LNNIFSHNLTPNKIHRPPEQSIEVGTQTNLPFEQYGDLFSPVSSPQLNSDANRYFTSQEISPPILNSSNRYSNVGIMKYQSRSSLERYCLPFSLPKK
jgi:hypothetical protein